MPRATNNGLLTADSLYLTIICIMFLSAGPAEFIASAGQHKSAVQRIVWLVTTMHAGAILRARARSPAHTVCTG